MSNRLHGAWLLLAIVLLGAAPPATSPVASAPAVVPPVVPVTGKLGTSIPLFNGKDLSGWTWHGQVATQKLADIWTVKEGVLHYAAVASNAAGYIDSDKEYKNFVLTLEYRHVTAGNGGIFVCINGNEKVWPNSIQIQGNFGNVGDLLNQNTGMKKVTTDPVRTKTSGTNVLIARLPAPAGQAAEKPLTQWNTLTITMQNGNLSVTNNGVLLNTAADISPDSGKVGIQAEGAEMEFRKIELIPIEKPE